MLVSVPVAAALPEPNTHPANGATLLSLPTFVNPSIVTIVFPLTTAEAPLPPAYKLPKIVESVT